MATNVMLQNRQRPGGGPRDRVVYVWPMDIEETFCTAGDDVFQVPEQRIVMAGTDRCEPHLAREQPCPVAWRSPPECGHERLDPMALPVPRCLRCGLIGADETARWLPSMVRNPAIGPLPQDESYEEEIVMLGQEGPNEH